MVRGTKVPGALVARNWVMGDEDEEAMCNSDGATNVQNQPADRAQDETCPLCMQTLDETDISFFACPCNYQALQRHV